MGYLRAPASSKAPAPKIAAEMETLAGRGQVSGSILDLRGAIGVAEGDIRPCGPVRAERSVLYTWPTVSARDRGLSNPDRRRSPTCRDGLVTKETSGAAERLARPCSPAGARAQ
jgi:hypothetical protein